MGIPPNGKKVSLWMCNIWRISDGKLVGSGGSTWTSQGLCSNSALSRRWS